MATIECKNLIKTYGKVKALDGLDLFVPDQGVFGFLGPNGAGKTTTIKILTGLVKRTGGECLVNGVDVNNRAVDHRRQIGYLSQDPSYYKWMTGRGLLNFVADIFGYAPASKQQRTGLLLEMAGLEEAADRKIGGYSGGMVQRIGIAQAMYQDPEVLFLDEPVAALDPIGRKEVLDFINELKDTTSVFMSTHILSDVERVCDEVAIIQAGRVVASGKATELMEKYSPGYYRLTFETPVDAEACCTILRKLNIEYICSGIDSESGSNADASGKESNNNGETVRLKKHDFLTGRSSILGEIANLSLSLKDITQDSATLEDVFVHVIAASGTDGGTSSGATGSPGFDIKGDPEGGPEGDLEGDLEGASDDK